MVVLTLVLSLIFLIPCMITGALEDRTINIPSGTSALCETRKMLQQGDELTTDTLYRAQNGSTEVEIAYTTPKDPNHHETRKECKALDTCSCRDQTKRLGLFKQKPEKQRLAFTIKYNDKDEYGLSILDSSKTFMPSNENSDKYYKSHRLLKDDKIHKKRRKLNDYIYGYYLEDNQNSLDENEISSLNLVSLGTNNFGMFVSSNNKIASYIYNLDSTILHSHSLIENADLHQTTVIELTSGNILFVYKTFENNMYVIKFYITNIEFQIIKPPTLLSQYPNTQDYPTSARLPNAEFVVLWETLNTGSNGYDVWGNYYLSDGTPKYVGFFNPHTDNTYHQRYPSAVSFSDGTLLVAWIGDNAYGFSNIYARYFSSEQNALSSEMLLNEFSLYIVDSICTIQLNDSYFVVIWINILSNISMILAQVLDSSYNTVGSNFRIDENTVTGVAYEKIEAASLSDGGFVAVWRELNSSSYRILARTFSSTFSSLGSPVQIESGGERNPDVAYISDTIIFSSHIDHKMNHRKAVKCTVEDCINCSSDQDICDECLNGSLYCPCHADCVKCIGPGSNECTYCIDNASTVDGECTCNSGYYESDNNSLECLDCPTECNTCDSPSDCTECTTNLMDLENGVCSCTEGYYLSSDECLKCIQNCNECTDGSSCTTCDDGYQFFNSACVYCGIYCDQCDSNGCKSCIEGYDLLSGGECACSVGYYASSQSPLVCSQCPSSCSACDSPSICTHCINSMMNLNSGSCECPAGNYLDTDICSGCMENCAECIDGSTCTNCDAAYYYTGSSCVSCGSFCQSCNENECKRCNEGFNMEVGDCVCPDGKFINGSICEPCEDFCQSCQGDDCERCNEGFNLEEGDCVCPEGKFINGSICESCGSYCRRCNEDDCERCNEGFNLEDGDCVCPDGQFINGSICESCGDFCTSCDSPHNCLECEQGKVSSNGNCVCEEGYYLNDVHCSSCADFCLSCTGLENCENCVENATLEEGRCNCISGYFPDATGCSPCPDACLECTSLTSCDSCLGEITLVNGACDCETGYYARNGNCLQCGDDCKRCENDDNCLECEGELTLSDGVCQCEEGKYGSEGVCLECPDYCIRCSGETNCLECESSLSLIDGECSCEEGFTLIEGTCVSCPSYCKRCSSQADCLECETSFELTDNECICPLYYTLIDDSCVYNVLDYTVSKETDHLKLVFSQDLTSSLSSTNIRQSYFLPSSSSFVFSIQEVSLSEYNLRIETTTVPVDCSGIFIEFEDIESTSGGVIEGEKTEYPYSMSKTEIESIVIEEEAVTLPLGVTVESTTAGVVAIGGSASLGSSLVSGNPSSLWVFLNIVILIYYMPLQNTGIPVQMKELSKGFAMDIVSLVPGLENISFLNDTESTQPSENWTSYGIETTDLLTNTRNFIIFFIVGLISLVFVAAIYLSTKNKSGKIPNMIKKVLFSFKWNFFLRLYTQTFIKLVVAGMLIIGTIDSDGYGLQQICGIFIICFGPVSMYLLVRMTYFAKEKIKEKTDISDFATFYQEFKCDRGFVSMLYYPLFFLRRYCFILGIYFLEDFPVLQVVINTIFSVLVLVFLVVYRPFTDSTSNMLNIITETILSVMFGLSGLFLLDISESTADILGLCMVVCAGFIIISIVGASIFKLLKAYRNWKLKRANVVPLSATDAYNKTMVSQIYIDDNRISERNYNDLFVNRVIEITDGRRSRSHFVKGDIY